MRRCSDMVVFGIGGNYIYISRFTASHEAAGLRDSDCAQRPRAAHNYRLNEHLWCLISIGVASFAHVKLEIARGASGRGAPARRAAPAPRNLCRISHALASAHTSSLENRARVTVASARYHSCYYHCGRSGRGRRRKSRDDARAEPGRMSSSSRPFKVTGRRGGARMISDF